MFWENDAYRLSATINTDYTPNGFAKLGVIPISVSFDRVADVYDRTRSLPSEVMKKLVETLTTELSGYESILDVGTGTGRFSKPLQDAGFEVVGIDISKKMIGKAREKGVNNLLVADACSLPFRDGTFDVSVCIHILHLIFRWKAALFETCRVTKSFMVSLHYARKDPVRGAYDELLKKHGYERRRPGKSEQELRDLASPAKSVFVCSYDVFADERLINLAQGSSSSQWEIPESVNQKVVEELRDRFAGRKFLQQLHITVWEIDDLKAYFEKWGA